MIHIDCTILMTIWKHIYIYICIKSVFMSVPRISMLIQTCTRNDRFVTDKALEMIKCYNTSENSRQA